jgi:HEPN domain-containing protein
VALRAMYILEATSERNELVAEARSDLKTAVDKLMERGDHYGNSKWASLQAAEKCLKAAIELHGGQYDWTHKLKELSDDLSTLGVKLSAPHLLDDIQCNPKIRYRKEPCSREQALTAHHVVLNLVLDLVAAGAKFSDHLTIRMLSPVLYQAINTTPPRNASDPHHHRL